MKRNIILVLLSLGFLSLLFIFQSSKFLDKQLHMVVCDIGQGDAIYIRADNGADMLIDGGPDDDVLNCLSDHMPFWDRTLEVVILTHPDADHLRGLVSVVERYKVNHFVTINISKDTSIFRLFQNKLRQKNIKPRNLFAGEKIVSGKTSFTLFWPEKYFFERNSKFADTGNLGSNDFAIVGKLVYGNFNALLTADAGSNILDKFSERLGKVSVFKVPHHGSKTGMSDLFLGSMQPELAIISVGAKNNYGHPALFSLELLNNHKIKTLRTDIDGEIEVVSDGKNYWLAR